MPHRCLSDASRCLNNAHKFPSMLINAIGANRCLANDSSMPHWCPSMPHQCPFYAQWMPLICPINASEMLNNA
uniref:Uncharacterized protein n=1 Tax=Caenorhabditis japonica TaxID=281687 RepID=A0A8R1IS81_CAEJA